MPTTVTGTAFTTTTTTLAMGDQAIYALPDSQIAATNVPVVLYAHGDGGAYDQLTSVDAWTGLRTWLLDYGWGWVESAGAGISTWGSAAARTSYEQAFTWMAGLVGIGPVVVLGRSMGGLAAYWLATQSAVVAPRTVGLIISSGVTDLAFRYHRYAEPSKQSQMRAAYGAVDDADWDAKTVGYDPMLFPLSTWDGRKILQLVGTADTNVVPEANAYAIRSRWLGRPAMDELVVRQGGDHETSNGTFFEVRAMTSFLTRVAATPPTTAFTATSLRLADVDGAQFSLTIGEHS